MDGHNQGRYLQTTTGRKEVEQLVPMQSRTSLVKGSKYSPASQVESEAVRSRIFLTEKGLGKPLLGEKDANRQRLAYFCSMNISSQEWELWALFSHLTLRNGSDLYNALKGLLCNFPKSWGKVHYSAKWSAPIWKAAPEWSHFDTSREAVTSKD